MRCFDENTYARLLAGELSSEQASEVQRHLDQCTSCLDLVAALGQLFGPEASRDELPPSDEYARLDYWRWQPGTVLNGKWTVDRLLGVGGMAAVYAATHYNRRRAALKVLHPRLSSHSDIKARFLREAYVANTIRHPGSVRIDDDAVAEDGAIYLVMELLEGESLGGRWARLGRRLSVPAVLDLAEQLLQVLEAAHAAGVIHRDLKPQNLFLVENDRLKVLDFGIARLREPQSQEPATVTGSLLGTVTFMAPEQARAQWRRVDTRSDIWAVGAIMFTLLTGRFVHEAPTDLEVLAMATTRPAPPISSVMPELPDAVAQLIDRALSFDPENRFASAASMRRAIQIVQSGAQKQALGSLAQDSSAPPEDPDQPSIPMASKGWSPLAVGLVGSAIALAIGATLLVSRGAETVSEADVSAVAPAAVPNPSSRLEPPVGDSPSPEPTTDPLNTDPAETRETSEPPIRRVDEPSAASESVGSRAASKPSPALDEPVLLPSATSRPSRASDPWSRRK